MLLLKPSSRLNRKRTTGAAIALVVALAAHGHSAQQEPLPQLPQPLTDGDYLFDGQPPEALVALGRDLFFDPILSGNRNISCGTCHDPALGTGDGLALGIGEGGIGAGQARRTHDPVTGRVPRNAPALWNIGAREFTSMFHDGRLEAFAGDRLTLRIPGNAPLPDGVDSLLAAQAFFPVTSALEMAGQRGENVVADALVATGFTGGWDAIADQVGAVPGYEQAFAKAFDDVSEAGDVDYRHIAQALAAFQTAAYRSDGSPFDSVLGTGDHGVLSAQAQAGLALFYGEAGCASCHSGPLLTDHEFHAIAVPQIGPGKGHGRDPGYWQASGMMAFLEDEGRYRVTGEAGDMFAFRTPSLRNVALTGSWGHSGAFDSLEGMVRHHLDAVGSLERFDAHSVPLPRLDRVMDQLGEATATGYSELDAATKARFGSRDTWVQGAAHLRGRIAAANQLAPVDLSEANIAQLVAFLESLTDPRAGDLGHLVPDTVPSGLPPQPRAAQQDDDNGA